MTPQAVRDHAYHNFCKMRGDFNGGFRASLPKLHAAQVLLMRAESAITDHFHDWEKARDRHEKEVTHGVKDR